MAAKSATFFLFTLILPAFCLAASPAEEVRSLERAWLDAYERRDVAAMTAIVAEDFVITFPSGFLQTKSQVLDSIKPRLAEGTTPERFHTADVEARVYGDTVILIGKLVSEFSRAGKVVREHYRYTDTYVRREGRWQVVASHLSSLPEAKR